MMLLVAALTALISVNGAVAALLPVVVVMAVRLGRSPSQLLMPLAFAAHAGSLLTLTGTPVNVIVSEAADERRASGRFGYFDVRARRRPAPGRARSRSSCSSASGCCRTARARTIPPTSAEHARTLVEQYELEHRPTTLLTRAARAWPRCVIPPRSSSIGETVFPGMVTEQRRSRRARRAAQGRGRSSRATRRSRSATRCCCAATWGALEREPRATRTCSSSTRRSSCGARPCRSGRARSARSRCSRRWSSCSRPARCPPAVAGLLAAGAIVVLRRADHGEVLPRDLVDDGRSSWPG